VSVTAASAHVGRTWAVAGDRGIEGPEVIADELHHNLSVIEADEVVEPSAVVQADVEQTRAPVVPGRGGIAEALEQRCSGGVVLLVNESTDERTRVAPGRRPGRENSLMVM